MLGTSWECHKVREFALRLMGDFLPVLDQTTHEESLGIPHEFPRSHWPTATGQCVKRYLSATMS